MHMRNFNGGELTKNGEVVTVVSGADIGEVVHDSEIFHPVFSQTHFDCLDIDSRQTSKELSIFKSSVVIDTLLVDGKEVTEPVSGRIGNCFFEEGITFKFLKPKDPLAGQRLRNEILQASEKNPVKQTSNWCNQFTLMPAPGGGIPAQMDLPQFIDACRTYHK